MLRDAGGAVMAAGVKDLVRSGERGSHLHPVEGVPALWPNCRRRSMEYAAVLLWACGVPPTLGRSPPTMPSSATCSPTGQWE